MKKTILMMTAAACLAAAQDSTDTTTAKKTETKSSSKDPEAAITIPEGAVKDGDHFRYVDQDGKAWIYRKTPFGITRKAEGAAPVTNQRSPFAMQSSGQTASTSKSGGEPDRAHQITAVREGDVIHFSKPSPFGTTRWDRKVTELKPDEQKIWDREQAKGNQ